ncbi:transposase [Wolbachia pipientis]|nr:transposase [Wolbachia pipientis]
MHSLAAGKAEGELEIFHKGSVPFQIVHIDHFGPLEATSDRYKYILVIVDAFTKFVWLFATKSTGIIEVINCLTSLFAVFGNPERIITDRGTAFSSNKFTEFVNEREIKHVMIAVASPWANGQVERVNRFLKSTLAKISENPSEWKLNLNATQYVLNNTLNKAIESTPSKLLLGYELRHSKDKNLRLLIDQLQNVDQEFDNDRNKARRVTETVNRELQEYNKKQYDKRHKKNTCYKEEDTVLFRVLQHKPGTNTKLVPKYKGPYRIKAVLNKNRYVITDIPGYNITQKPLNTIVSADKLKPWIRIAEPTNAKEKDETESLSSIDSD